MPIFFAFFDFAERAGRAIWANPVARWVVLIVTGLFIHRLWLWRRDSRVRKEITKDVVEQIEEQTNDRVEQAREAAASTDDLNAEQLRKLRARDPNNRSRLP
jgi:predicted nucleic acid-binding protein